MNEILKKIRLKTGLSVADFARKVEIPYTIYFNMERYRTRLSFYKVLEIANKNGYTLDVTIKDMEGWK